VNGAISYAWFWHGNSNRPLGFFSRFAPAAFRSARAVYPDLELVVYHDDHLDTEPYGPATRRLAAAGVLRLVDRGPSQGISHSSLWRLLPLFDPGAGLVVCRDLDSACSVRERWAVEEFVRSGKAAHAINDTASHCHPAWPNGYLMPGTCAFNRPAFTKLEQLAGLAWLDDYAANHVDALYAYGKDEVLLNQILQPLLEGNLLGHVRGIPECALTADLDQRVTEKPGAFVEYVGQVMTDPDAVARFYSGLPSTRVFYECGA
jgi:hypothetical protein